MLVDHPEAEAMGVARSVDRVLAPVEEQAPRVGPVVADDALHERALAGAVLAEDGVKRSGRQCQRDVVEGAHVAEALGHPHDLDQRRSLGRRDGNAHRLRLSSRGAPASVWRGDELRTSRRSVRT